MQGPPSQSTTVGEILQGVTATVINEIGPEIGAETGVVEETDQATQTDQATPLSLNGAVLKA